MFVSEAVDLRQLISASPRSTKPSHIVWQDVVESWRNSPLTTHIRTENDATIGELKLPSTSWHPPLVWLKVAMNGVVQSSVAKTSLVLNVRLPDIATITKISDKNVKDGALSQPAPLAL